MTSTILFADDNALDNAILRNCLYKKRYNFISALNGREALDLIESRNVDLIIMDLTMPVMDGFEFLKIFSRTRFYEEIPIIVATSINNLTEIKRVMKYNIYDYVIKPLDSINSLILENKIKNALQYRNLKHELGKADRI